MITFMYAHVCLLLLTCIVTDTHYMQSIGYLLLIASNID